MKTIYKANGRTFKSMYEVVDYAWSIGMLVSDSSSFNYKGIKVITVNLKSK